MSRAEGVGPFLPGPSPLVPAGWFGCRASRKGRGFHLEPRS